MSETLEDDVQGLVDAGLLTERQAEAYVLRDVEAVPRGAAAEMMGISPNTLDDRIAEARRKVKAAEATLDTLEDIRHEEFPSECAICESTLGGRWTRDSDDRPVCLSCAGIEEEV